MGSVLSAMLGLLSSAPAIIQDAENLAKSAENILTNTNEGKTLVSIFDQLFHHSTTAGTAVTVTPKSEG